LRRGFTKCPTFQPRSSIAKNPAKKEDSLLPPPAPNSIIPQGFGLIIGFPEQDEFHLFDSVSLYKEIATGQATLPFASIKASAYLFNKAF